jgi:hypothetical protein
VFLEEPNVRTNYSNYNRNYCIGNRGMDYQRNATKQQSKLKMNIGQLIIIGIGFISGAITLYLLFTTKDIEHEK